MFLIPVPFCERWTSASKTCSLAHTVAETRVHAVKQPSRMAMPCTWPKRCIYVSNSYRPFTRRANLLLSYCFQGYLLGYDKLGHTRATDFLSWPRPFCSRLSLHARKVSVVESAYCKCSAWTREISKLNISRHFQEVTMDTLTVAKFAQHRVNWITVCQCYLGHTRASVYTSCEWPITAVSRGGFHSYGRRVALTWNAFRMKPGLNSSCVTIGRKF